jgi:hypothetical protein
LRLCSDINRLVLSISSRAMFITCAGQNQYKTHKAHNTQGTTTHTKAQDTTIHKTAKRDCI